MHTPEFSRQAALVFQSPYWVAVRPDPADADYEAKVQEVRTTRYAFQDAVRAANSYDDLSPEMKKLFDAAEKALMPAPER